MKRRGKTGVETKTHEGQPMLSIGNEMTRRGAARSGIPFGPIKPQKVRRPGGPRPKEGMWFLTKKSHRRSPGEKGRKTKEKKVQSDWGSAPKNCIRPKGAADW